MLFRILGRGALTAGGGRKVPKEEWTEDVSEPWRPSSLSKRPGGAKEA